MRSYINHIKSKVDVFRRARIDRKFYTAGGLVFFGYVACSVPLLATGHREYVDLLASAAAPVAFACFAIAVACELAEVLVACWESWWFKLLIAFLTFFSYEIAKIHADNLINDFTSIDPGKLPAAQTLLTSLYIIPSWIGVLVPSLLVFLILGMSAFPLLLTTDAGKWGDGIGLGRIVGVMALLAALLWLDHEFKDDESLANTAFKAAVIESEYHAKSECLNVKSGELSADLGRGYVSVFLPERVSFETRSCELATDVQEENSGSGA